MSRDHEIALVFGEALTETTQAVVTEAVDSYLASREWTATAYTFTEDDRLTVTIETPDRYRSGIDKAVAAGSRQHYRDCPNSERYTPDMAACVWGRSHTLAVTQAEGEA